MFSTRSSSGKSKTQEEAVETAQTVAYTEPEIVSGSVVETARFLGQFMVGKELEPMSSISNGQRFREYNISLTYLNTTFMKVVFTSQKATYTQLIPWSAVSTVILK